ncbi:MAG: hypothetical protein ACRDZM_14835, partial [Acidimicrobiia bacterium]
RHLHAGTMVGAPILKTNESLSPFNIPGISVDTGIDNPKEWSGVFLPWLEAKAWVEAAPSNEK